jgi:hypothetical protein
MKPLQALITARAAFEIEAYAQDQIRTASAAAASTRNMKKAEVMRDAVAELVALFDTLDDLADRLDMAGECRLAGEVRDLIKGVR